MLNYGITTSGDLYELICSDFQDIFLSEKAKCKRMSREYSTFPLIKNEIEENRHLSICKKDNQKKNIYLSLFNGLLIKFLKPKGFNGLKFRCKFHTFLDSFRCAISIDNYS